MIKLAYSWVKDRLKERTSYDGVALIGVGVAIILAGPFTKIAAYGAIGYGAWTLYKKEQAK
jgi:EamA domain-containing membrane protein RarD